MNERDKKSESERRRVGKIVHDDRGTASVEWVDAPADFVRDPLSLQDAAPVSTKPGGNPYDNRTPGLEKKARKKDLRKLGEWIKTVKAVEEKKLDDD